MGRATGYERRVLTAFFDTRADAEAARDDLVAVGFAKHDIRLVPQYEGSVIDSAAGGEPKSFWHALKDLFLPHDDRSTYAEGLRRGGVLLSVVTIGPDYSEAARILDRDGAINIALREEQWKREGWERDLFPGREEDEAPSSSGRRETLGDVLRYRSYVFQEAPPAQTLEDGSYKERGAGTPDEAVDRMQRPSGRPEE
jgi:hypothetical protein